MSQEERERKQREKEVAEEKGGKQSTLFDFLGNNSEAPQDGNPLQTPSKDSCFKNGTSDFKEITTEAASLTHDPALNPALNKEEILQSWGNSCRECQKCSLYQQRTQAVFGEGNVHAVMMLVGEAPGADEDRQGFPFVGNAGKLLDNILKAISVLRTEIYITNIVKCRPPGNRLPYHGEVESCAYYLSKQIEIIDPAIIVCLGSLSTKSLIDSEAKITLMRGQWCEIGDRWYMPTFHPAALLRDPKKKKPVWEDFQQIKAYYDHINPKQT